MANPHRGEVEIVVGGEPMTARLTVTQMIALEQGLGKPLMEAATSGDHEFVVKLIHKALVGGGSKMTEAELMQRLDDHHTIASVDAMAESILFAAYEIAPEGNGESAGSA